MVRQDYVRRSKVTVKSRDGHIMRTYRFNKLDQTFSSPFISWANLDRCGGWRSDEKPYLEDAVLSGKKLYAGRVGARLDTDGCPHGVPEAEAIAEYERHKASLPDFVNAGIEDSSYWLNTYICRKGSLAEYYDLDAVFAFYEELGYPLAEHTKKRVEYFASFELAAFGTRENPFDYTRAQTDAELITTGLLLGYPLESTCSILQGY